MEASKDRQSRGIGAREGDSEHRQPSSEDNLYGKVLAFFSYSFNLEIIYKLYYEKM